MGRLSAILEHIHLLQRVCDPGHNALRCTARSQALRAQDANFSLLAENYRGIPMPVAEAMTWDGVSFLQQSGNTQS